VVKTFLERLVLINNSDMVNAVNLMKTLNTVLNQFSKLDSRLDSVRNTLDDNSVRFTVKQLISSLQIAADTNSSSHSDLVRGKRVLSLFNSAILIRHNIFRLFYY